MIPIPSPVRGQGFTPYIEWRQLRFFGNPAWDVIQYKVVFNWDEISTKHKRKQPDVQ